MRDRNQIKRLPMPDTDTDPRIIAIGALVLLAAFALIGLLWPYEPITTSGPFWRPQDWERRNGSLRGVEERERKEAPRG